MVPNEDKMEREINFWKWFLENHLSYQKLENVSEKEMELLLDVLLKRLQKVNPNFYFEIEGNEDETKQLIISSEGEKEFFENIYDMVDCAPQIDGWEFIALRPPKGFDYLVEHNGLELASEDMYFIILENEVDSSLIGLKVGIHDFDKRRYKDYYQATYMFLEICLGEQVLADDVNYLDVCELPSDLDNSIFVNIAELDDYLSLHKLERN